jgi:hypothetical protein
MPRLMIAISKKPLLVDVSLVTEVKKLKMYMMITALIIIQPVAINIFIASR